MDWKLRGIGNLAVAHGIRRTSMSCGIKANAQVANEETVLFVGFLVILTAISKSIVAPYNSWAEGHIGRIRDILYKAKDNHASSIKTRLDSLESLKDVVPLTEQLYNVSKETNKIEHENFLLEQESAIKAEVKAVLDSWVRYEQQQREAEQLALFKTVTANVASEIAKPATQKALLEEALAKVESLAKAKEI